MATHLVSQLLSKGYGVRATVRHAHSACTAPTASLQSWYLVVARSPWYNIQPAVFACCRVAGQPRVQSGHPVAPRMHVCYPLMWTQCVPRRSTKREDHIATLKALGSALPGTSRSTTSVCRRSTALRMHNALCVHLVAALSSAESSVCQVEPAPIPACDRPCTCFCLTSESYRRIRDPSCACKRGDSGL